MNGGVLTSLEMPASEVTVGVLQGVETGSLAESVEFIQSVEEVGSEMAGGAKVVLGNA